MVDISLIRKAFHDAAVLAFSNMMMVTLGEPAIGERDDHDRAVACALVKFSGDLCGEVAVRVSNMTANNIALRTTGEMPADAAEAAQNIGELASVICGNAKRALSEHHIKMSLPEIKLDENMSDQRKTFASNFSIQFCSEIGSLVISVGFENAPA